MDHARRSRGIRLAMLFAACLTSATAFGLHPEPSSPGKVSANAPSIGLPGSRATDSGSHDCVACRVHRPIVSVPFLQFVPAPRPSAARAFASRPSLVPAFAPDSADGRAPPDLS